jgi:hypothetical protein
MIWHPPPPPQRARKKRHRRPGSRLHLLAALPGDAASVMLQVVLQ